MMILIMFYSFYVTVRQGSSLGSVNNNQEALHAAQSLRKVSNSTVSVQRRFGMHSVNGTKIAEF